MLKHKLKYKKVYNKAKTLVTHQNVTIIQLL